MRYITEGLSFACSSYSLHRFPLDSLMYLPPPKNMSVGEWAILNVPVGVNACAKSPVID